jgi:hypothetical protein
LSTDVAWASEHPAERPPGVVSWGGSAFLHLALVVVALLWGARGHKNYEPPIPPHVAVTMVALPRAPDELPDKPMIRLPDPGRLGKIDVRPPEPERPVIPTPEVEPDAGEPLEDPPPPEPTPPTLDRSRSRDELVAMALADLERGPETRLPTDPDGRSEPGDLDGASHGQFNPKLSAYQRRVRDLIQEKWFPIESVLKENPDLVVVIGMRIDPNGKILEPGFIEESGHRSFDSSALRAVRMTGTLPLPPADLQEEAEKGFVVTFSATDKLP